MNRVKNQACPKCGEESTPHCENKPCGWHLCKQTGCAPKAENGREQETVFTNRGASFYRVK